MRFETQEGEQNLRLKNAWTPPTGTLLTQQRCGNELVFPVVFGRTEHINDEEQHRTHFGLWFVHMDTGVVRFVEAPFYLEKGFRHQWRRKWVQRGTHEGSLIFSMSQNLSYDIGYNLFLYDGEQWTQITRNESNIRSLTLGEDHDVRVWTEPGKIEPSFLFKGGDLAKGSNPTRFAVDYTHAFAYDSGPETPRSPEYIALCAENEKLPPAQRSFTYYAHEKAQRVYRDLPEAYQDSELNRGHFVFNGDAWVTIRRWNTDGPTGFIQLIQLTGASKS